MEALAVSTGDPEWYLEAFKKELNVTMPWLSMDTRLPNPYYQEQFDLWGLVEEHPTLVVLDSNGVIRYRGAGYGGTGEDQINYRYAFDLIGELIEEASAHAADIPTGWDVGQRAPDFSLNTLQGETYTLSDYFGKTVLLSFWGTGCLECGDLVPGVYAQEILDRYNNPQDFVVLGIDHYTPQDFLEDFIEQMEIKYPVLVDAKGDVFSLYRVLDEFVYIVIDPQGLIRYRDIELEGDIYGVLDALIGPAS